MKKVVVTQVIACIYLIRTNFIYSTKNKWRENQYYSASRDSMRETRDPLHENDTNKAINYNKPGWPQL